MLHFRVPNEMKMNFFFHFHWVIIGDMIGFHVSSNAFWIELLFNHFFLKKNQHSLVLTYDDLIGRLLNHSIFHLSIFPPDQNPFSHNISLFFSGMDVPEFPIFLSQVFDITQTDFINGFQLTWNKKIGSGFSVLQGFTISPRVYPVELSQYTGEVKQPGNYQIALNGNFKGKPFTLGYNKQSGSAFSLTIPFDDKRSVNVAGTIGLRPDLGVGFLSTGPVNTTRVEYDINNKFNDHVVNIHSSFMLSPSYGFGTSISIPFAGSLAPSFTLAGLKIKDMYKTSVMLHHAGSFSFAIGKTYTLNNKTVTGVTLKIDQEPLKSELRLGLQRNFIMSRISVVVSSSGIVNSFFQRNLREGIILSTFLCADNANRIYHFGAGLVLDT